MFEYREFWKRHETLLAGLVGASGSIIGGVLTLYGVKWTIDKQRQEKFIELYPTRVNNLERILALLDRIESRGYHNTIGRNRVGTGEEDLITNISSIRQHALLINGKLYVELNKMCRVLEAVRTELKAPLYNSYEDEQGRELTENSREERENYGNRLRIMISHNRIKLNEYKEQLDDRFDIYSKRLSL